MERAPVGKDPGRWLAAGMGDEESSSPQGGRQPCGGEENATPGVRCLSLRAQGS